MVKERVVKSVAIIGGGPSGLAVLYELLHVDVNEASTVHSENSQFPDKCRFEEVVLFERNEEAGGIWKYCDEVGTDLNPQLTKNDDFNDPKIICPPTLLFPEEIKCSLRKGNFTYDHPLKQPLGIEKYPPAYEWYENGLYASLHTNTPELLMRYSYQPRERVPNDELSPLIRHHEVLKNLQSLADLPEMNDHIRYNSSVQKVTKVTSNMKWEVVVRQYNKEEKKYSWYTQYFDAIVIASGRQHYPHYPVIEGLSQIIQTWPERVSHSKNFRSGEKYKNQDVLIVGCNVSAVDIVKQIYREANSVSMTIRSEYNELNWVSRAIHSPKIIQKGSIKKFRVKSSSPETENSKVIVAEFENGSSTEYHSVIFATGYHSYYPFMDSKLFQSEDHNSEKEVLSNKTRVKNLYLHTFYNKDPSLTVAGLVLPSVLFHLIETQAIAIAGVYSNIKFEKATATNDRSETQNLDSKSDESLKITSPLPDLEIQKQWEVDREAKNGVRFESYECASVQEELGQILASLGPRNRQSPLEIDSDAPKVYKDGLKKLEELFIQQLGDGTKNDR